jgi:hypothetical protein
MIHLLLKGLRYAACTAQASPRPRRVSVKRPDLSRPPLLSTFFRGVPFGTLPPRRVAADASLVSCAQGRPWGRRTKHPSGSRLQDVLLASQTSAPGTWRAPDNRQCPAASHCILLKCHGSLVGPVSLWLTAEASPDSTSRWQAICDGVRSERIQRYGCQPYFLPVSNPNPTVGRPSAKGFLDLKGHQVQTVPRPPLH